MATVYIQCILIYSVFLSSLRKFALVEPVQALAKAPSHAHTREDTREDTRSGTRTVLHGLVRKPMSSSMRVSDQWGGNHVFFRCCGLGPTLMRVKGKNGPFGSLGGLVLGAAAHLIWVEPYFLERTYGISTAVFCLLALLSCIQLTVSFRLDPSFAGPPLPPAAFLTWLCFLFLNNLPLCTSST